MTESIVLNSPILLVGYIIAAALCVFDIIRPSSGYVLPIISAVLFVATSVFTLLMGAEYSELCIFVLIFLALNLTAYMRREVK